MNRNTPLSELAEQWKSYHQTLREREIGPSAIGTYSVYIRLFIKQTGDGCTLSDLTKERLSAFYSDLTQTNPAGDMLRRPRSVHIAWAGVLCFCKFLILKGWLPKETIPEVKRVKMDEAHRETVSEEEALALLHACEKVYPRHRAFLSKAVLVVFIGTAIRNFELRALEISDLNLNKKTLRIRHGKGNKERVVVLSNQCADALENWLDVRPKDCVHNSLFCQDMGRRLGERGITSILEELSFLAGYEGNSNIRPHSLRHFAATRFYQKTQDLHATSKLLGHSNLQTTQLYLHTSLERLLDLRNATELGVDSSVDNSNAVNAETEGRETRGAAKPLSPRGDSPRSLVSPTRLGNTAPQSAAIERFMRRKQEEEVKQSEISPQSTPAPQEEPSDVKREPPKARRFVYRARFKSGGSRRCAS